ncbi:hypothetical protein LY39_02253 [Roseinatronobacter bogoriensis subsp. barguzinensis]|nr:hypothetical protein [Rhodobaca bogoriensis DSM 18756]TDW37899.1 hypothetical protein LY39_02253 [Rhodobaca barguzinensis]TDY69931.1 hypothetical protein EV660_103326 [Rhodobaca bogoriensis DSM 18756]
MPDICYKVSSPALVRPQSQTVNSRASGKTRGWVRNGNSVDEVRWLILPRAEVRVRRFHPLPVP